MEINELNELNALYKAILNVKFPVDEDKLFEIAGSPIIVDILSRVAKEMSITHDLNIDNNTEKLNYVKNMILSKPEMQTVDQNIKKEVITNLIFPYNCSEELFNELMSL